jgi:V/A-type H+-transporting ATPase subunit E
MHKTLQKGDDKIQQICDQLRLETLDPAREEAKQIVDDASVKAEEIIAAARKEVERLHKDARNQIEQERNVFESSLEQASKMVLEKLRQSIEKQLLREELFTELENKASSPEVIAKIINALIDAIDKEGINSDLQATIPRAVSVQQLTQYLTEKTLNRLKKDNIVLNDIRGGVQLKLKDKRITLDMTEKTLQDLLVEYVGSAFRERLFVEQ